jgi:hypothetical protein
MLLKLSERTSARWTQYLSGWLGVAKVVGFKPKELDKYGNMQLEVFVTDSDNRP